jgi:hypothetical protein
MPEHRSTSHGILAPGRTLEKREVRYRGLAKNTAQIVIVTLFALSNLWMARRQLMGAQA